MTNPSTATSSSAANAAAVTQPGVGRIAATAATLTLLVAILFAAFALPARAATNDAVGGGVGSGVGTAQHPVASKPTGSSGALVFGALCLGGIVAAAGGVLWYTVRTRRTLDQP